MSRSFVEQKGSKAEKSFYVILEFLRNSQQTNISVSRLRVEVFSPRFEHNCTNILQNDSFFLRIRLKIESAERGEEEKRSYLKGREKSLEGLLRSPLRCSHSALDPLEKEKHDRVVCNERSRFGCVIFEKERRTLVTLVTWNRFRRRTRRASSKTLKGKRRKIEWRI